MHCSSNELDFPTCYNVCNLKYLRVDNMSGCMYYLVYAKLYRWYVALRVIVPKDGPYKPFSSLLRATPEFLLFHILLLE